MERFNLKVGIAGPTKKIDIFRGRWDFPISLTDVIATINELQYDDAVKEELIKKAKKYPDGAYRQFQKNIKNFAVKIEKDLKKN